MIRFVFLTLLISGVACVAKPTRRLPAKATRQTGPLYSAALEVTVLATPRDPSVTESGVTLNPKVQDCLREALRGAGDDFSVVLGGAISRTGSLVNLEVQSATEELKACLMRVLQPLTFGGGPEGRFGLALKKIGVPNGTSGHGKVLLIDLATDKNSSEALA